VQVGWARGVTFPGTPFNQQMTVPVELALRDDGKAGPVLAANPVAELASLREKEVIQAVKRPGSIVTAREDGKESRFKLADNLDAFEVVAELDPDKAATVGFDLRGTRLIYDVAKQMLTCKNVSAPVRLRDGKLRLHILVDRGSVEVYADGGRVALSVAALADEKNRRAELFGTGGGEYGITEVTIYRLKSSWGE
jgi:fructan beta-fructosidase